MSLDSIRLEVRFRPDARDEFRAKVVPFMRRQARLSVVVGAGLGLLIIGTLALGLATSDVPMTYKEWLVTLGLLAPPACFVVVGMRKLRRTYNLPEVVLTVTDGHVVLGPMERMTLFGRWRPELRWDRRSTEAEFVAGNGIFTQDRIKFTSPDDGMNRAQYLALPKLDTTAEDILAAVRRP